MSDQKADCPLNPPQQCFALMQARKDAAMYQRLWLIGTFVSAIVLPIVMLAGIAVSYQAGYGKAKSDIAAELIKAAHSQPMPYPPDDPTP